MAWEVGEESRKIQSLGKEKVQMRNQMFESKVDCGFSEKDQTG